MATPPVPDSSFETARSNLETLDTYLNATSGVAINREGLALTPIPQVANQLNTLVSSTAWLPLTGTFTTGATLTERNHILLNPTNSQYYSWGGTLPKVVPASSTPASSGGIALNAWVLRQTDASLRSQLGTAAFRNAMTSINDMATANALVERGAFGLGATSGVSPPTITNLDALDIPAGMYRITTSITGTLPFGYPNLSLIVCRYNSVDALQIAATTDNNIFFRHSAAGTWGGWKKYLAYTAGSVASPQQNLNNQTETGFFEISNGVNTNVPASGSGVMIHITRGTTSPSVRHVQIACIGASIYQRENVNGTWSSWVTSWSSANLNYLQNVSGGTINPNTTVAGSSLAPSQSGTWRCWSSSAVANNGYSIWNRIA